MSNFLDQDFDSDEDEDYVPEGEDDDADEEAGSEEECDEVLEEVEEGTGRGAKRAAAKGKKKKVKEAKPKEETKTLSVDDVWAKMLAQKKLAVGTTSESTTTVTASQTAESVNAGSQQTDKVDSEELPNLEEAASISGERLEGGRDASQPTELIKITEVFDFAGDEIKVEREVTREELEEKQRREQKAAENLAKRNEAPKRRGGISGALTLLAKKPKMSVLDKSSRDWEEFKTEKQIKEELVTANRGKDGYLEKVDFLTRADHRQFDKEKALRNAARKPT